MTFYTVFTENNEWQTYNSSTRLWYRTGIELELGPQNSIALVFHASMKDSQGDEL